MIVRRVASVMIAAVVAATGQVRSAETHRFVPQAYYNTYSAAHPPALRIRPGDRVSTTTVDAAGAGADGETGTAGGKPETGPVCVEGAEADDMRVGTLEQGETRAPTA